MKIAALRARVHKVVNAGDLTTLSRKGVRQQLSPEFGGEFIAQNKLVINRTIEAACEARGVAAPRGEAFALGAKSAARLAAAAAAADTKSRGSGGEDTGL